MEWTKIYKFYGETHDTTRYISVFMIACILNYEIMSFTIIEGLNPTRELKRIILCNQKNLKRII